MKGKALKHGQCTAKNRQGKRCQKKAILGGTVCRLHGGDAPQVKTAARARLAAMVSPALGVIEKIIRRKTPGNVELAAARDILDRNGFKPSTKLEGSLTVYDAESLRHLSDDELGSLIGILEKLETRTVED